MHALFRPLVAAALLTAASLAGARAADVVVSSKIDTEGSLLGSVIAQALAANGVPVKNRVQLGTTPVLRKAITSGEIDIYPEYTGNGAFFFNKPEDPAWHDAVQGYDLVRKLDSDANHIDWLTPAPANNTWAIGLRNDVAAPNDVKTMSDFGKWVSSGGHAKLVGSAEFVNSAAALPSFEKAYGFKLKPDQLLVLSGGGTAATIQAAAEKTDGVDAAMVFGTDGGIEGRRPRGARRRQEGAARLRADAHRPRRGAQGQSEDRRHPEADLRRARREDPAGAETPASRSTASPPPTSPTTT